jgi:hypothetical protein
MERNTLVFCVLPIAISAGAPAWAFDYFEHRYLGNAAYDKAVAEYQRRHDDPTFINALGRTADFLGFGKKIDDPTDSFGRILNDLPLRFGDLSAMAGDLAGSDKELMNLALDIKNGTGTRAPTLLVDSRRQWFNACKWVFRVRRGLLGNDPDWENCFRRFAGEADFGKVPNAKFGSDGYHASREELAGHEMIPGYISLASQNIDHFPRRSWKSYSNYHDRALYFARCYRKTIACAGSNGVELSGEALLAEALVNEGFAQHFLQDSFAAGHIGTDYGPVCSATGFGCVPTKRRVQQTHDALNELGLGVTISRPPEYIWGTRPDVAAILQRGWTVFGDESLFVPEADFQRAVIEHTAARSIGEILESAGNLEAETSGCRMCTTRIFPVPDELFLTEISKSVRDKTDLTAADYPLGSLVRFEQPSLFNFEARSLDSRVTGIPVEGLKFSLGFARQYLGYSDTGSRWRGVPSESGMAFRLDYVRNGDPAYPNVWGLEYWNLPDLRTSYIVSAGYSWPRELAALTFATRAKIGVRTEEPFARNNPTSSRVRSWDLTLASIDITYELYRPMAILFQYNLITITSRHSHYVSEYAFQNKMTLFFGLRFDVSGI